MLIRFAAVAMICALCSCTKPENEPVIPDTITLTCREGLDADCDAAAFEACPNGYEIAARIKTDPRGQTSRSIRCR